MSIRPRIVNILAKTASGTINFQGTYQVKYLYGQIRKYFEQELLSCPDKLFDIKYLQSVLTKKAKKITFLDEFEFDSDLRVIELAILVGVLQTSYSLGKHSKDYVLIPGWQLPHQIQKVTNHFRKGSWDGFLLGMPKSEDKKLISIPLELKSLMINPILSVKNSPNEQLKEALKLHKSHFQKPGSINCVLIMPFSSEKQLNIDLKIATDDLRANISPESIGFICLLTFPYNKSGKLSMSILFAMLFQNPSSMSAHNHKEWMQEINFGKL